MLEFLTCEVVLRLGYLAQCGLRPRAQPLHGSDLGGCGGEGCRVAAGAMIQLHLGNFALIPEYANNSARVAREGSAAGELDRGGDLHAVTD